ncbi:MAG: threonine-phosphate decarboxylase [Deltaproteobacteria bacterium]|nr:threonine-phosphate decarboxylase [Deltaproteobacteria bacterium]
MAMAKHGGAVFREAAAAGISPREIIDFSANINPLGLPRGVLSEMRRALENLGHYPEIDGESLVRLLARRHQLEPDHVIVGNGSTALIYLLARVLRPARALLWVPAFSEYERALRQNGSQVFYLTSWESGRPLPLPELAAASRQAQPDLVFICNPNNPTGQLLDPQQLESMLSEWEKTGIIVVLDEAFIDFAGPEFSLAASVKRFSNLIILRSLTKIYALAGVRCGYLLSAPALSGRLRALLEPWSLNSIALAAAVRALSDRSDFLRRSRELIEKERDFLLTELKKIPGLEVYPSRANYLLTKIEGEPESASISRRLFAEERILIRICDDYVGLNRDYLRFAVRGREDNRRLVRGLGSCLGR